MKHIERARELEREITTLEARMAHLQEEISKRPFPGRKGQCRRSGRPRPHGARLCASCISEIAVLKRELSAAVKKLDELRADHGLAAPTIDELVAEAHRLGEGRPIDAKSTPRQMAIERELQERFWDGIPGGLADDAPRPQVMSPPA